MDEKKRISWTEARDLALLVQIITKGVTAFVTSRANTKEKKTYNQMEAWTNSEDGILTLLAQHRGVRRRADAGLPVGYQPRDGS